MPASTARDIFQSTMAQPDGTGNLKALSGIQIEVFVAGTATRATIYQSGDVANSAEGPVPASGAVGTNPFTTGATGAAEFYAKAGAYEIEISDVTVSPPRITTRKFKWNALPADTGGVPANTLATDGTLPLAALAEEIMRQAVPIGAVIDWYRPSGSAITCPPGFVPCDGRPIADADHDFDVAGTVNVPDLRNRFVIGADTPDRSHVGGSYVGDGTTGSNGNVATNSPGIRGEGGSNAAKNLTHTHGIPNHTHTGSGTTGGASIRPARATNGTYFANHSQNRYANSGYSAVDGLYEQDHDHPFNVTVGSGTNASANPQTVNQNWTSDPGTDFRPLYYGLLKIMKVRRA